MTTPEALSKLPVLRCYVSRKWRRQYQAWCVKPRLLGKGHTAREASDNLWHDLAKELRTFAQDDNMEDWLCPDFLDHWVDWSQYAVLAVNGWLTRRRLTWKIISSYDAEADVLEMRSEVAGSTYGEHFADGVWLIHRAPGKPVIGLTMVGLAKREDEPTDDNSPTSR